MIHISNCRIVAPFNFGNVKNLLPFFNVKAREMTAVVEDSIKENPSEPIESASSSNFLLIIS